jgi:ADP-ribose pyrophosphatase YjhB (NUDIX family)
MNLWLLPGASKIPIFASHHCGVAGLVINEDKILVVREKSKIAGWKLPGGYANLGEDLDVAAIREVFEETGIRAKYRCLLGFRHSHNIQFGRGDLYFICRLEPETYDVKVDEEIEDAKWMTLKEFRESNKHEMLSQVLDLVEQQMVGLEEKMMRSVITTRPPFRFYFTRK